MTPVLANVGVPMIFWQLPAMAIALVSIVAVETAVAHRFSRRSISQTARAVGLANIVSTFVGIPLAWAAMLTLNILSTGGGVHGFDSPFTAFQSVVLQASWLVPYEEHLAWLIPAATLVLLVPYFVVSVFLERFVLRKMWKDAGQAMTSKAAWSMNAASYGLLALLTAFWLRGGLAG